MYGKIQSHNWLRSAKLALRRRSYVADDLDPLIRRPRGWVRSVIEGNRVRFAQNRVRLEKTNLRDQIGFVR